VTGVDRGSIGIRRLASDEALTYRQIRLAGLKESPSAFGSTHAVEAERPLEAFVERLSTSVVFAAEVAGEVLGMAGFKRETGAKDRHKGFVWGMYVDPVARGHGVGAALLKAVIDHAETEFEHLTLAVTKGNAPAIALYERFGFVTYGVEPRALKGPDGYDDEVLMALFLPR